MKSLPIKTKEHLPGRRKMSISKRRLTMWRILTGLSLAIIAWAWVIMIQVFM